MKGPSMNLTREERGAMLSKIEKTVAEKYYDPAFNPAVWQSIVARNRSAIIDAASTAVFEQAIRNMLWEFAPKSLGLLSKTTPINSRSAINASFSIETASEGFRWVFQDVLPGGVAEKAGVHSGDILLTAAGKPMTPTTASAAEPPFEMEDSIAITIRRGSAGQELSLSLQTGEPKYKDNPYSDLTALKPEVRKDGIAYLRVSLFPGKIGIDFAKELDRIFTEQFRSTDKLIIDLRGNPGGGIGGLTLMSYLTPDRLPIGYSRNRRMALDGTHPSSLPIFDKVPRSKLAIPGLALKFLGKTSIHLYTEALAGHAYHGRVVILVNEHTTGAAEMLAQFAKENRLATIVGSKTPGRLVSRSATKLGNGYRLVVPVAAYVSAKGTQIEGNGIVPDVAVSWSSEDAMHGLDYQLATATEVVQQRA